jgi:hypothetical protein
MIYWGMVLQLVFLVIIGAAAFGFWLYVRGLDK